MKSSSLPTLRKAAAVVAVAGVALTTGSTAAGALPEADAYKFVAKMQFGVPGVAGSTGCSAVLVAPRWVVTAKACFAPSGQTVADGAPSQPTTALIGWSSLSPAAGGQSVSVVRVVPHPDRDLALARLAVAVTDTAPVAVATSAPVNGDILAVVGFGRTATGWVPDTPHVGTFTVGGAGPATVSVTGTDSAQVGPCKGDAGGPGLRESGSTVQLVAITHTGDQGGCLGAASTATHGGTQTRVDDLGAWFGQYLPEHSVSTILNDNSDLCLAITGGSTENAAGAIQWPCGGGAEQDWRLTQRPSGAYEIRNDHSGQCLAMGSASTTQGQQAIQWPCGGDSHLEQTWALVPDGTSGYAALQNVNSGQCLAIGSASKEQGAGAIQWPCRGTTNREQQWRVAARTVGARVVNQYSRLCLSNDGVQTNGAGMVQATCTDSNDLEFHLTAKAGGFAQIADDRTGLCLAIGSGATTEGARAIQWTCGDNTHGEQQWSVAISTTGATQLRNKTTGKCLDIADGSKNSGVAVTQQTCSATDTGQTWQFTDN